MAVNLPSDLRWVLEMLGYEWPGLDEDEMRRAAEITRTFRADIEGAISVADSRIYEGMSSCLTGQASAAYIAAWDTNSQTNMRKLCEILDPVATGIDIAAGVVEGLKIKVVAELVITAAQIAAAATTAFFTFGMSAAANVLLIAARKKALTFITNVIIEELISQVAPMIIEPLTDDLIRWVNAMLESELVENVAGDPKSYVADLTVLEQCSSDLSKAADEQESLAANYISQLSSCNVFVG